MNGSDLVETVRDERATALRRLGSDKYLIAATGADLSTGPVLRSVATNAARAKETFDTWATEESGEAAATFETAADTEADHYERIAARLDDELDEGAVDPERGDRDSGPEAQADAGAVSSALQSVDGTAARAGALLGRGLVADRTRLQVVNFFVNEGDQATADLARDLRSDATEQAQAASDLLDAVCESDEDWDAARSAAEAVIQAAYEEYVDALESMGVDPKPVC